MKLFSHNFEISEFIPPIFYRIKNLIRYKGKRMKIISEKKFKAYYPYNYIPISIDPKLILDIGANNGDTVISALKTFPKAKIICFEPVKETFEKLIGNLSPFKEKIIFFNAGLSSQTGKAKINITSSSGANSIEPQAHYHKSFNPGIREHSSEEIQILRLDDIYKKDFPLQYVDIVKIDVEGHEIEVLKGGAEFFSTCVDIIIIEISFQRDTSWENQQIFEIFSLLNIFGFSLINIFDIYNSTSINNNNELMVTQIDCVFRSRSKLTPF
jgi:FkbM family methyltransferase